MMDVVPVGTDMKILVIEDNVAIRNILTDLLTEHGHDVMVVSSAKDYMGDVSAPELEAIFLDTGFNGGDGLKILDSLNVGEGEGRDANIILMMMDHEQYPKDNLFIKGVILKPFSSADVLNSLNKIANPDMPETVAESASVGSSKQAYMSTVERKMVFGDSYVFFQEGPRMVYDATASFNSEGYDILLVTTGKMKAARERFRHSSRIAVKSMSIKARGGYMDVYPLGSMIDDVEDFIKDHDSPIVVIDDLNRYIEKNGVNSVLMAVHHLTSVKRKKRCTFLVSVDVKNFNEKDKGILLNCMKLYNPVIEEEIKE